MVKKIVKFIVILVLLLLIVAGCTEFNGTIFDMIKVRQQAITYIHTKYHVPMEHIEAEIYDTKNGDTYFLSIRIRPSNYVEDIEEPEGNPISDGSAEKEQ